MQSIKLVKLNTYRFVLSLLPTQYKDSLSLYAEVQHVPCEYSSIHSHRNL